MSAEYKIYKVKEQSVFHLRKTGDLIKKKKLGGGGFGEIYLVSPLNDPENTGKLYALKVSKRYRSWQEVNQLKYQIYLQKNKDCNQITDQNVQDFNLATNCNQLIEQQKLIKEQIEAIEEPAPKSPNWLEIRESTFLRKLQGEDYIVQFYEFGFAKDKTCTYLLMEYVETNIQEYLFQNNYDPSIINESFLKLISRQILTGLQTIHLYHIIHRDIKPENILFDPEKKQVKISDFGLSRYFTDDTKEYTECGTGIYKPPDVILGSKFYGFSFDIWSVGVTLAEFLLGRNLFEGGNALTVYRSICEIFGEIDESLLPGVSAFPRYKGLIKNMNLSNKKGYGLKNYLRDNGKFKVSENFYDLIESLLVIDPRKRINCTLALKHPWFMEE